MVNFGYPYNDIVICKDSTDYLLRLRGSKRVFLQLQFEAFYTVNLLNAKWKVVPARNSGWKKIVPIGITICLEVFEFEAVIFPCTGVSWREDVLRFNRRESVNNFVKKN